MKLLTLLFINMYEFSTLIGQSQLRDEQISTWGEIRNTHTDKNAQEIQVSEETEVVPISNNNRFIN